MMLPLHMYTHTHKYTCHHQRYIQVKLIYKISTQLYNCRSVFCNGTVYFHLGHIYGKTTNIASDFCETNSSMNISVEFAANDITQTKMRLD